MELPAGPDLRPGGPEPGQLLGKFARVAVMAHYMEAQYRATVTRRPSAAPT